MRLEEHPTVAEILKLCNLPRLDGEDDFRYVVRLCRFAILLSDEKWNLLGDDAKGWINKVVAFDNMGLAPPLPRGLSRGVISSFRSPKGEELFLHVAVCVVVKGLTDPDDVVDKIPGRPDREEVADYVSKVLTVLDVISEKRALESVVL